MSQSRSRKEQKSLKLAGFLQLHRNSVTNEQFVNQLTTERKTV